MDDKKGRWRSARCTNGTVGFSLSGLLFVGLRICARLRALAGGEEQAAGDIPATASAGGILLQGRSCAKDAAALPFPPTRWRRGASARDEVNSCADVPIDAEVTSYCVGALADADRDV